MDTEKDALIPDRLYYRLIALWVICEVVAGGIVHGLHIPFSGMIVSGFAVICICLIGYYGSKQEKIKNSTEVSESWFTKGAMYLCFLPQKIFSEKAGKFLLPGVV